ncbi:Outer arm dynein light chain 1 protein [Hirschfeldia incana]|nr:Outer arm dynein light chain 1 protein [Hirschfeldia incana]
MFSCFAGLIGRKKNKRNAKPTLPPRTQRILQIRREEPVKPLESEEPTTNVTYNKFVDHKDNNPTEQDSYDGEDERDDKDSTHRESPPIFQVQEQAVESLTSKELGKEVTDCSENEHDNEESGHVSDPGLGRATSWVASPKLKRSCSTLSKFNGADPRALNDPRDSFETKSVRSHRSADRVMLKKHSSMQILPSGSRRLWWKLFLWSHRNLHKHLVSLKSHSDKNHQSGYTSDFAEQNHQESANNHQWPSHNNQWVAFSAESSSMKRVDEWVRGLDVDTVIPVNEEKHSFIASPKMVRSPSGNVNDSEAIKHANSLIQSLSKSSSVAHISSIGLKAVPSISHFTSLKSIDLSNNFIVQITPASLPKGLHALNLSKNKISVIEGLRELTRLRVLDLSYNRISRIGQGLSNCTLIKELYLAGNKISNVEGLHRLLKLIVLDLSFNKIATTKAIGQLVANYNSLVALNILGNPIQSNVGEDQLRKTVSSLLPKLVYLNKQLIKPQRAREVLKDSVAKAAFGGGDSLHHRRKRTSAKRVVGSPSHSSHHQKGKGRGSKGRSQHQLKKTSTAET